MSIPYRVGVGVLGWKGGGVSEEGSDRGRYKCVFELRIMKFKMCRLGTVSFLLSNVNVCYLLFLLKHFHKWSSFKITLFLPPKLTEKYNYTCSLVF